MEHITKEEDLIVPVSPSLLQAYLALWHLKLPRDVLVDLALNTKRYQLCSGIRT